MEYCVNCEKNVKNYICDDDPETGTGWFFCEKCWNQEQMTLARIYEADRQEQFEYEMAEQ